jgi:hypothetical protein
MRSDTGRTDSLWMATAPPRALPPLAEDLRTDVAVIGAGIAGIAGIATAYLLALMRLVYPHRPLMSQELWRVCRSMSSLALVGTKSKQIL